MTLNLTLDDTLLDISFIPALSLELLSPSFSSIGAIWNLIWPWPWVTHPPRYHFHTRPVLRITFPKFQLNRSNLKFDLTLTLGDTPSSISFSYPPCPQDYFPQVSAQSEQFEIWPDLDPRSPNQHKLGVSRTKLHPHTKFEERGTYSLWEKWWTDKHPNKHPNKHSIIYIDITCRNCMHGVIMTIYFTFTNNKHFRLSWGGDPITVEWFGNHTVI